MTPVWLSLGSNVQREQHLGAALEALSGLLKGLHCSAVFESHAVNYRGANFYNLVVSGHTALSVQALDRQLKQIESDNGREQAGRGCLPLDIDILLYGDQVGCFEGLVLPRPGILNSAFVLWPMALLAPGLRHPLLGQNFAELWQAARLQQPLWPVAFRWRGQPLTSPQLLASYPLRACPDD